MRPVFASSAIVRAPERLVLAGGRWRTLRLKVRYGILRHPEAGLVLIDTGYGPRVTKGPRSPALRLYAAVLGPELLAEGQPEAALQRLGATPEEVRAIVVTHFHADHVAALGLFPQARIFAQGSVLARIMARSGWRNLRHGVFTELLPAGLAARITDIGALPRRAAPLGLGAGHDILGDASLLAIDLPGHAEGHFGLCFTTLAVPLLYAVDVQWLAAALGESQAPGFPATLVADDQDGLAASTRRVAAFREAGGDVLLCHDPLDSPYDLADHPP